MPLPMTSRHASDHRLGVVPAHSEGRGLARCCSQSDERSNQAISTARHPAVTRPGLEPVRRNLSSRWPPVLVSFRWVESFTRAAGHRGRHAATGMPHPPASPRPGVKASGANSPAMSRPRPPVVSQQLLPTHSALHPSSGRGDRRPPPGWSCQPPPRPRCTAEPGWQQNR